MRRSTTLTERCARALRTSVLFGAALFVLSACSDDDTGGPNDSIAALSRQLGDRLNVVSGGAGTDFFVLPASDNYAAIPQDPRNPITAAKVELGKFLYHETEILTHPKRPEGIASGSCASCHHADAGFQAGVAQGIGEGGLGYGAHGEGRVPNPNYPEAELDVQPIRSPTVLNTAYQEVTLWNGQFGATGLNEGTEAQWTAETPKEKNHLGYHGVETQAIAGQDVHRLELIGSGLDGNTAYKQMFAAAFPEVQEPVCYDKEHVGLAIAAYERTILANQAPFQRWLRGDKSAMSEQELHGALVFFGEKAQCYSCHTGPALNTMTFHALGMNDLDGPGVYGNGPQDADMRGRGGFTQRPEDNYKFKTPQLYNLADVHFFGHGASITSIRDMVEYLNNGLAENPNVPQAQLAAEFKPLNLSAAEMDDLTAFLTSALYDGNLQRYVPGSLPSGACFPNNDSQSRQDRGCN